ncbi:MAG: carboxymuconolactone decarboxylase family protein [Planctomycetota bacterium]|jgi:4-carboxymuconolactone decarboxylase
MFSAAVTLADNQLMAASVRKCLQYEVNGEQLYEAVLQSYLFLGFPRMLMAAECLSRTAPVRPSPDGCEPVNADEFQAWSDRGVKLCKKVYGTNYDMLKERVEGIAPEIFQWMILEGYGKVLSRPGLDSVSRELSSVACLMVENRSSQLYAHMRGAINVGASEELLTTVVDDIGAFAGDGHSTALEILARIGAT